MQAPRTRDATFVLRVWQEPHDAAVRGRLTWVGEQRDVPARGADQILAAVTEALRRFVDEDDAD
jgi:hypothetical protein